MVRYRKQPNYDSAEWKELRASILERDGHRCRNCGSEKELTVHH
jgi:5-methylcytosine-specific restriction endonuclease McrA